MAEDGFTTVRIRNSTMERIRQWADQGQWSISKQIDLLVDAFSGKQFQVIAVSMLPRPEDINEKDIPASRQP